MTAAGALGFKRMQGALADAMSSDG
jgi:hypothetical protein